MPPTPEQHHPAGLSEGASSGGVSEQDERDAHRAVPDSKERRRLEEEAEATRRRLADAALVQRLRHDGFNGLEFDNFTNEMAAYALSVMHGWLLSGHIFVLTARRGLGLENGTEFLSTRPETREELANMTVAVAWRRFHRDSLLGGGWQPEGGANITTYFMGACILEFPNIYRAQLNHDRKAVDDVCEQLPMIPGHYEDPVREVLAIEHAVQLLGGGSEREKAILTLVLDGYEYEEIAQMLAESSPRAVEGVVRRWRQRKKKEAIRD